jgi:putative tryptophan/tyrosine transport system substrate-binding protein
MKRREFITLLGGAVAWPLPASALQTSKLPTIGFLSPTTASVENQRVAAFVHRLRELGWIEGRTTGIKLRWVEGGSERTAEIVVEFARQKVDFIVSGGTVSVLGAKQATSVVIPIVFAEGDPVGNGFVVCLAPGGNVTGLPFQQTDFAVKRHELLREVVPTLRRLAILANAGKPVTLRDMREAEAAAGTFGLTVVTVEIRRIANIATGFA